MRIKTVVIPLAVLAAVLIAIIVSSAWPTPGSFTQPSQGALPAGITLQQIDGGPHYFADLHADSAWMDSTMLIGAWEEQPLEATEVRYDRAMGNNIYWSAAGSPQETGCGGPCLVDYDVMRAGGMHICTPNPPDASSGSETVCSVVGDELDMSTGPDPAAAEKAYDRPRVAGVVFQGYGKGVLFWENDAQARQFMKYSDILAADSYWMTDASLGLPSQGGCGLLPTSATACGKGSGSGLSTAQRELPANYAYNVTRLENLQAMNDGSKPVIADVETGCPFVNSDSCTTPAAAKAAAWHAIIAGARGILWFQHNFGGPCGDDITFYDGSSPTSPLYGCQQTPGVTLHDVVTNVSAVNHEILDLNSVLLSPFAKNYVTVGGADVSVMAKYSHGRFYIFAASARVAMPPADDQSVTFTAAGRYTGPVTVIDENRTLQAVNGVFTDTFADEDSVHIYELGAAAAK